jgi:hypothetical protein
MCKLHPTLGEDACEVLVKFALKEAALAIPCKQCFSEQLAMLVSSQISANSRGEINDSILNSLASAKSS